MDLTVPAALEREMEQLQATLVALMADLQRLETESAVAQATLSQHAHDWTRDITGKPATYTPETHTHANYASSTHIHPYQDYQYPSKGGDTTRQTSGPV